MHVFETPALRPNLWSEILLYNKRIKIKYLLGLKIKIMEWWIKREKRRWNMATCTKKYGLMITQRQSYARKMFIWDQAHHIKFLMRAQFRSCIHWENVLRYTNTRLYFFIPIIPLWSFQTVSQGIYRVRYVKFYFYWI